MLENMLENIEALLFDLDGTLVDSMWIWRDIDITYLGKFGITIPEGLQSQIEGMSFTETAHYFKERFSLPDSIEKIKADWNELAYRKYMEEVPLKTGVAEFLQWAQKQGLKMGIATSNSVELVQKIADVHGLHNFFPVIKTSCDAKKGKPAPDIYLLVAGELGVAPEKCLVFEDIIPGIQAGKAAGMKVCAVEDAYSAEYWEEKKQLADYFIHDYTELMQKADEIENGPQFLPISTKDMEERNIEQLDFIYVTGDAYVDHPSFGTAIISRVLEAHGYSVGIIAQPDWKDDTSIRILGEPRLGFLVSAGNMDSMVNHYFVSKKHRPADAYSPGGEAYKRPDHATVVYCNLIRRSYRSKPIIIGGIEASLRRMAHYDYWSDSFKRSILLDSQADLISYGMGEKSIVEIAEALQSGIDIKDITFIAGTVYKTKDISAIYDYVLLPSYEEMKKDKKTYAQSFYIQSQNTDAFTGKFLIEPYPGGQYVVQNTPQKPLTTTELDAVYALPYMRTYHPVYEEKGGIPAIKEIQFSLTSNRGCFGGCNFCALTFHQGRTVQVRSHESVIAEAKQITQQKDFKGYIHDVGGPTANFRHPSCEKQLQNGVCKNKQCLFPAPCKNLTVDHSDYLKLLHSLRRLPKVKKVFVRSGIRFDYLLLDNDQTFFRELVEHHISGQLKVAPEHISDAVLQRMGKPKNAVYNRFRQKYAQMNESLGKNQFLVPYLMSSHPGSTLKEAVELAEYLRDLGYMPEQVQDFYPTPSTLSTIMYYTEIDPRDNSSVYVPKSPHEKAMQRALIQYRNPNNYDLVREALHKAGREDLIGFDKHCLIKPRKLVSQTKQTISVYGKAGNAKNAAKATTEKAASKTAISKTKAEQASARKPLKKKTLRNIHKKK